MKLPIEINQPSAQISSQQTVFILVCKLGMWLSLSMVICSLLFKDTGSQFTALISTLHQGLNLSLIPWAVLIVCLSAFWTIKQSFWQVMKTDTDNSIKGIIQRFIGFDVILVAILILIAYPIPAAPEFYLFRLTAGSLAGFILIFGRKAAFIPGIITGVYGLSLLITSLYS